MAMTKEELKAYNRAYYEKNKDRMLEQSRLWKEKNRDAHLAYTAEWQRENSERANQNKIAYKKRNPEKVRESAKRVSDNARAAHAARQSVRNRLFRSAVPDEVIAFYRLSAGDSELACHWCGSATKKGGRHVDHVQPVARGGRHSIENLVISCVLCNLSKGALNQDEFLARRKS